MLLLFVVNDGDICYTLLYFIVPIFKYDDSNDDTDLPAVTD